MGIQAKERQRLVGRYEGSKRKANALPSKALAEHFRCIKYAQLNSDIFTGVVDFYWDQMVEEYRRSRQVGGLMNASIYEVLLTLRHFQRAVGVKSSKEITQPNLDDFVLKRSEEVGRNTLNKDIRNTHAFLTWAGRNRLLASGLEVKKVEVAQNLWLRSRHSRSAIYSRPRQNIQPCA